MKSNSFLRLIIFSLCLFSALPARAEAITETEAKVWTQDKGQRLLNAFADGKFGSYWFGSGTPTYLIKMLEKFGVEPSEVGGKTAAVEYFDAPTETMFSITPLLYQSGYITIKGYDSELGLYTLDIPNKEVRVGLMRSLLPYYVSTPTEKTNTMVAYLSRDIRNGDMDTALRRLSCLPFLIVTIRGMKVTISRCSTLFSAYWVLLWMLKSVPPVVEWMWCFVRKQRSM